MDVDAFLESVSATGLRLPVPAATAPGRAPETVDALFHLPLLALAVMVIARRTPFPASALGRRVALLLVENFRALHSSQHGLATSLTLMHRCADALAFLEAAGLAAVSQDRRHVITLTPAGKTHLDRAGRDDKTDLGLLIRQLRTNQERAKARIGGDER
jgi:hypothetical protein